MFSENKPFLLFLQKPGRLLRVTVEDGIPKLPYRNVVVGVLV